MVIVAVQIIHLMILGIPFQSWLTLTCIFSEWEKKRKVAHENAEEPSFFRALVAVFGKYYVFLGVAILFDECVIR